MLKLGLKPRQAEHTHRLLDTLLPVTCRQPDSCSETCAEGCTLLQLQGGTAGRGRGRGRGAAVLAAGSTGAPAKGLQYSVKCRPLDENSGDLDQEDGGEEDEEDEESGWCHEQHSCGSVGITLGSSPDVRWLVPPMLKRCISAAACSCGNAAEQWWSSMLRTTLSMQRSGLYAVVGTTVVVLILAGQTQPSQMCQEACVKCKHDTCSDQQSRSPGMA